MDLGAGVLSAVTMSRVTSANTCNRTTQTWEYFIASFLLFYVKYVKKHFLAVEFLFLNYKNPSRMLTPMKSQREFD